MRRCNCIIVVVIVINTIIIIIIIDVAAGMAANIGSIRLVTFH